MTSITDATASSLTTVAESTLALVRAEVRLALAEGRAWLTRLGRGLGLLWLGLLLTQVFSLLAALSPILLDTRPWYQVVAVLLLALIPALLALGFAARELRKVGS
jgi:hypothetical protein